MDAFRIVEVLQPATASRRRHVRGDVASGREHGDGQPAPRSTSSLRAGERSHWHRVDAAEIWHFYAGDTLELRTSADGRSVETARLGPDLAAGERPQLVVAPHAWQTARSLGAWTLVGCTVSPGFEFDGFELAPAAWEPPGA